MEKNAFRLITTRFDKTNRFNQPAGKLSAKVEDLEKRLNQVASTVALMRKEEERQRKMFDASFENAKCTEAKIHIEDTE